MKSQSISLLRRLKNQAQATGLDYQTTLQLFCQEEFLRRLENSKYCDCFILKGGFFIYTLSAFQSRATQDIDFLVQNLSNNLEQMRMIAMEIIESTGDNQYILYDIMDIVHITQEKKFPGIRIKLICRINNVRIPLYIDLGMDDVVFPKVTLRSLKTRLADFRAPKVYTYSLESTIAEKFDAIIKRMEATSRMKDFFDIYFLSELYIFDGLVLQKAIKCTIEYRGTEIETNYNIRIRNFRNNIVLIKQWERFKPVVQMDLPSFDMVLDRIEKFIFPLVDANLNNEFFYAHWNPQNHDWMNIKY